MSFLAACPSAQRSMDLSRSSPGQTPGPGSNRDLPASGDHSSRLFAMLLASVLLPHGGPVARRVSVARCEAENLDLISPELDEAPFREAFEVARMAGLTEAEHRPTSGRRGPSRTPEARNLARCAREPSRARRAVEPEGAPQKWAAKAVGGRAGGISRAPAPSMVELDTPAYPG
jgi:hypothetical protein